jgi:hypothetical protein
MMIMVLHPTKLTTLLTTVVCVFFVALALSFRMNKAEPKDILSATAAYAAVLVVFVGANDTTSKLSDGLVGAIVGGVIGAILLFVFIFIMTVSLLPWVAIRGPYRRRPFQLLVQSLLY